MGKIVVKNNAFIYEGRNENKLLLDCNDYLANKSRIPMHSFNNDLTIPGLLHRLLKIHPQLCGDAREEEDSLEVLLINLLMTSTLIRSSRPVKVLEIGCQDGILSYHLATILGLFNKESTLCCVCDTIGNDSGNQWLDRIALVETMPKLSMLAADYDETNLETGNFDIVIINGTVRFEEPLPVLKEAARLVKEEGMMMCYVNKQPLLESTFKMLFEERMEYSLTAQTNIMTVSGNGLWIKANV